MKTSDSQIRVAVLMTAYNRVELTLKSLSSLFSSIPSNWKLSVFLADDASSDGTPLKVLMKYPGVEIINGDGNWFWAHSMYQAELAAGSSFDAKFWLNQDVILDSRALQSIEMYRVSFPESILVGQTREPKTNRITYGGFVRTSRNPLKFSLVFADSGPIRVDSFNGNLVFIPHSASSKIGNIDGAFHHAYADIDYGLRATTSHVPVIVLPGFLGECARNYTIQPKKLHEQIALLMSRKAMPIGSQIRFLRKHGPFEWPIYLFTPYLRVILNYLK